MAMFRILSDELNIEVKCVLINIVDELPTNRKLFVNAVTCDL